MVDVAVDQVGDVQDDRAGDSDGILSDVVEDSEELGFKPHEPPEPFGTLVLPDPAYRQESNHVVTDGLPDGGNIVALVRTPHVPGEGGTVLVGSEGLWLSDGGGETAVIALPDSETAMGAVAGPTGIFVASQTALYSDKYEANFEKLFDFPEGATFRTLDQLDVLTLVATDLGLALWTNHGEPVWISSDDPLEGAWFAGTVVIAATSGKLLAYAVNSGGLSPEPLWTVDTDVGAVVGIVWNVQLPQQIDLLVVGSNGLFGYEIQEGGVEPVAESMLSSTRVPLNDATCAAKDGNGGFVVGTAHGAYRIVNEDPAIGPEYRVYVPNRWMPNAPVTDIALESGEDGEPQWVFATTQGYGRVTSLTITVADKVVPMQERVVLRHDRDGAIADSHLTVAGDLSSNIPWDSDNDGGWTCYWLLSECFRYKVTGDPEAKAHFDRSLERMLSYRTLTGTDWFLARAVIRIEGCQLDDCDGPDDGEWFLSPDGEWWVKADTSNDEVTSHMFMMGHAYDLCADKEQRQAIAAHVDGIIGGIVDNDFNLVDPQDGLPTSYGQFGPDYVNSPFGGMLADGGRRAAQMIGALNLAYYVTGKEKYLEAKKTLIAEHDYDDAIRNIGDEDVYPLCAGHGDCDELAMQAFFPLLRYETNDALRVWWMEGWNQLYSHLKDQEDAVFDMSHAVFGGDSPDLQWVMRWFRRYPTDLIRWVIYNEPRQDLTTVPDYYLVKEPGANIRRRSDGHIFPADERPNERHNTNQFRYLGGHGPYREMDGADAIFPYWMGRYYGFVKGPEE